MQGIVNQLIGELNILLESSEQDFNNKRYDAYEDYIKEYNRLSSLSVEHNIIDTAIEISFVPPGKKSAYGGVGTTADIAKHREIINETKKLLLKLQTLAGASMKEIDVTNSLELLFSKFHIIARQLRNRHGRRNTLEINDEYDVQDLLHALLRLFVEDVRPEEWTPSYAGGSKRMDFLLKEHKTVIEVKRTRDSLTDKEVGEQLLIDIEVYKEHPDCKRLVCFVYDPEGRIGNPIGIETDLEKQSREGLDVKVYIYPK